MLLEKVNFHQKLLVSVKSLLKITFVRRVTVEDEIGGGKRRLEMEDEGPRFGVTPAELGDHLNGVGRD